MELADPSLRLRPRGVVCCVAWYVGVGVVRVLWSVVSRSVGLFDGGFAQETRA